MSDANNAAIAEIVGMEIAELDMMLKAFEAAKSEEDLGLDMMAHAKAMVAAWQERDRRIDEITQRLCADLIEQVRLSVTAMIMADQGAPDKIEYEVRLIAPGGNFSSVTSDEKGS